MKALQITPDGARILDVPKPAAAHEALVKVTLSGICNTDLELMKGYAGFSGTIGHEFVGVVASSSDESQVGKRVVGEINAGCGKCADCLSGDPRHCAGRTVLGIHNRDGSHAEFLQLPSGNLIEVPESVSNEQAVFAEPLAAAYGITERWQPNAGERIAVIGDGKLGILCARALKIKSKTVTLIGKHPEKLRIAENSGIAVKLLSDVDPAVKFDVVVEASGAESGFKTSLDIVKPRGTIFLKSTFHYPLSFDSSKIVVDEISVIGSRCGRLAPAIDLLREGTVEVDDLISEEFRLADGEAALKRAGENGVLKVLLRP